MATEHHIPVETLRQLLRLDPETGRVYWRPRGVDLFTDGGHAAAHNCAKWNAKNAGCEAFTRCADGYFCGQIFGRRLKAHRVIFALHYGHWPVEEIDHKDKDRKNNRPDNLREATSSQNSQNRNMQVNNKTGFIGVYWWPERKCYKSSVQVGGVSKHVGLFKDPVAAAKARDIVAKELHGQFAKLNFPD